MNIGLTAHNSKKSLMEDFCIAYKGILTKHDIFATGTTGKRVEEATGLKVVKLLPGSVGGDMQFMEMVERNSLDLVIFFYNPYMTFMKEIDVYNIVRVCDEYSIPVATNVATAEMLILGMDRGDLDWRLQVSGRDE